MANEPHLLFVDDENLLHNLFERLFTRNGFQVTCCASALQAMDLMKENDYDLVITDFMMPDMDGFALLGHIRQHHPSTRVIMVTAHANVQHAVRMMQHGAIDYIPKPFTTAELLDRVNASLAAAPPPADSVPTPKKVSKTGYRASPTTQTGVTYIGESPSIQRLKSAIPRVSANRAPVFIQGESGTGKEVLAKLIHHSSDRASGPYVTLNCANLPRELVESHLFGHKKGAFTGAIEDMTGAFERAHGGTLLLDEITEVELPIQAKLLRVLQEGEIQRVGASETKAVDVRIIATSNRNLSEALSDGIFREDLYHRLAVFPVTVPPLRERDGDVPLLAHHFVDKYCGLYSLGKKTLSEGLLAHFDQYPWPGNVRELENMIQRGVLLSAERSEIRKSDVYDDFFADALEETGHNQQAAADKLGISARTIRNKLRKYREDGLID
jgi:two-component system response regulator FlrC